MQAGISIRRLGSYLKGEELNPNSINWSLIPARGVLICRGINFYYILADGENSVQVIGGNFTWDSSDEPFLKE